MQMRLSSVDHLNSGATEPILTCLKNSRKNYLYGWTWVPASPACGCTRCCSMPRPDRNIEKMLHYETIGNIFNDAQLTLMIEWQSPLHIRPHAHKHSKQIHPNNLMIPICSYDIPLAGKGIKHIMRLELGKHGKRNVRFKQRNLGWL